MTADELKAQKAKNLRWKRPICRELNFDSMRDVLEEMTCECDDIKYYLETTDEDTLINALCGDEDEAAEFRIAFSDLSADCDRMWNDLGDAYIPKWFDLFFVAVTGRENGGGLLGWDSYEHDYYGLDIFESGWAEKESKEKLVKLTKKELLEDIEVCLKILYAYIGIKDRYTNLKAAIDILKGQNMERMKQVKTIEEAYEAAAEDGFDEWRPTVRKFDDIVRNLPDDAWLW